MYPDLLGGKEHLKALCVLHLDDLPLERFFNADYLPNDSDPGRWYWIVIERILLTPTKSTRRLLRSSASSARTISAVSAWTLFRAQEKKKFSSNSSQFYPKLSAVQQNPRPSSTAWRANLLGIWCLAKWDGCQACDHCLLKSSMIELHCLYHLLNKKCLSPSW